MFTGENTDVRSYMSLSVMALVTGNLIPLFGVLFLDWDVGLIIYIYWIETAIIGALNVPKILTALGRPSLSNDPPSGLFGRIFLAAFFCVHFGMFCAGHLTFLTILFDVPLGSDPALIAVAGLALSHGFSLIINWFGKGEFRRTSAGDQMFSPYIRIVIMHIVIIIGGMIVAATGAPTGLLVLLIILKIVIDIASHQRAHDKLSPSGKVVP